MSGLGRRSHYRKHLTDSVLHDFPEPDTENGERIAKVVGTRGSNQFEIIVAQTSASSSSIESSIDDDKEEIPELVKVNKSEIPKNASQDDQSQLAILPTKFRKLVWLKRNDFVIVSSGDSNQEESGKDTLSGGIRYMIKHILYKDQVKHLKEKGFWPSDPFFLGTENIDKTKQAELEANSDSKNLKEASTNNNLNEDHDIKANEESNKDNHGIIFHDNTYEDDYFVNTNHIAKLTIDESDTESDDE